MKISVTSSLVIGAPAARVWSILAEEFETVAQWASTIPVSTHNPLAVHVPKGATTGGRSCTVPGFGVTDERFTHFDADRRALTYSVTSTKMPGFVSQVHNSWQVDDLGDGRCTVTSTAHAVASGLLGLLAAPMLQIQLARTIRPVLADLRAYAETGRISARKERLLSKQAAR